MTVGPQDITVFSNVPGYTLTPNDMNKDGRIGVQQADGTLVTRKPDGSLRTTFLSADDMADYAGRTGLTPFSLGAKPADANHSPAINAAIDRLITAGGGTLWLPPIAGDWKIGGPINLHKAGVQLSNLQVRGVGEKARLTRLGATGDIFVIGNGTTPVYFVRVSNLQLSASVTRTGGVDFKLRKANNILLEDIVCDGAYAGIDATDMNSGTFARMNVNMPNQTSGYGVIVRSDPSGSGRSDTNNFEDFVIYAANAGSYGMLIDGRVHGCNTDRFFAIGTRRALQLTSSAASTAWGDIPSFCEFRHFETDRALEYSATLEKGYENEFYKAIFSNTSGAADTPYPQGSQDDCALFVGQGMTNTKFFGGRAGNCRTQAMQNLGLGTKTVGMTFSDASKIGVGSTAAVFTGSTARGFGYHASTVEGYGRASYAFQFDGAAKNGMVRDTTYKGLVNGYSSGAAGTVSISGQISDD